MTADEFLMRETESEREGKNKRQNNIERCFLLRVFYFLFYFLFFILFIIIIFLFIIFY